MIWSGVTTLELAKVIEQAIAQGLTGLYHVAGSPPINKYDLLGFFNSLFLNNRLTIRPVESKPSDKSLIDTRRELKRTIPPYADMIDELAQFVKSRLRAMKENRHDFLSATGTARSAEPSQDRQSVSTGTVAAVRTSTSKTASPTMGPPHPADLPTLHAEEGS